MAKIKPLATIENMSGKVCMHSNVYFRTNKVTGKVSTGKLCNPSTKPASADQLAVRSRFEKVQAAVRERLENPQTKAKMEAEYKAQTTYGSLFGYCFHKWNDEYDEHGDPIQP